MTSYMRSKISQATSTRSGSSGPPTSEDAEKYRLLVTAGPSYDLKDHKIVHVNDESSPTYIENDFLRAKIHVRVRGFRGLPSSCPPTSEYFNDPMHERDQYSLGFSFVPKQDLPSLNTVWGNDLDHPVRDKIPPGFNTAFRIVKEFIDPGLSCDVYADEPWLYGPSLSCWFGLRVGEKVMDGKDFDAPGVLAEGADGTGREVRYKYNLPENNEKRRKFFLSPANREPFVFEKDRLYQADFYNPYISFSQFSLKLPGFSLKVLKYIGEKTHCLRYVFKNRETGEVYFNVNFTLLWGEQLRKALREDEAGKLSAIVGAHVDGDAVSGASGEEDDIDDDDGDEEYHSMGEDEDEVKSSEEAKATPADMQLHPGDHGAAADHLTANARVDEIDELLKKTSTSQQRSGTLLNDVD
ncbi:hypothetical protein M409DRAFT_67712 [Zasmidium cellare ATCC 36951]|uniref:Domain of unknown function at the cortex 1 domain-containing protein n=1 Tax=Zasmidium cellare ATCC 36951 TaxID=1080233 RepID=A0A6A6CGL6_ZASCE|nr:uncharacterized protein M409DRAFT_67712 [Zasmidium cellare ATCC 36951]KAF2164566.1 hypothetical protein M409DRAFT_67712 [Zasmidium cellare ATCC 36951]